MAAFAYNNAKNASTGYILFKFNCRFYTQVLFKEDVNPYSKSYLVNKLVDKLKELIEIYCQNLFYV